MRSINPIDPWSAGFLKELVEEYGAEVASLLEARAARRQDPQGELNAVMNMPVPGAVLDASWRCSPPPADLMDRRVEITGPGVDAKMVIGAANSGAQGYMVDGEDSLSPTWAGVLATHSNLWALIRGVLRVERGGTEYTLNPDRAVVHYRPRGLHMVEEGWKVDGVGVPAALFDAGLYVYQNARELLQRGSGPYLYLPKLEVEAEARFWHRVASWMEARLELPKYSIRFTVLVETLPALVRLEPIVWALRKRLVGLNVGRWDYIFSCLKVLRHSGYVLPDRRELTMNSPPLAEYARWVVNVAHRRGCHAIGGMAAHVPSRKDAVVAAAALEAVEVDKLREVALGHDGTWVAHPDLVCVARQAFDSGLRGEVEQRRVVPGVGVLNVALVTSPVWGRVTEAGVVEAVKSVVVYLDAWLRGNGCVAMDGKMEDVATAEISRVLLWNWVKNGVVTREYVEAVVIGEARALAAAGAEPLPETLSIILKAVSSYDPPDFITTVAYPYLMYPQVGAV